MLNKISNLYWLYLKSKSTVIAISSRVSGVLGSKGLLVSACRTLLPSHHVVKITSSELLSADQKTWVRITCGKVCLLRKKKIFYFVCTVKSLYESLWSGPWRRRKICTFFIYIPRRIFTFCKVRGVSLYTWRTCVHMLYTVAHGGLVQSQTCCT